MNAPIITGHALAAQKMRRELKERILEQSREEYADEIGDLCEMLEDGEIDAGEWLEAMMEYVRDIYTSAYVAGRSGRWQDMTFEDWGRIGQMLRRQYRYLRKFERQLQQKSLAQTKAQAQLYAESATQAYQRGYMAEIGLPPGILPAYPGDGSTNCMARCHCRWAIRILDKAGGDFNASWKLGNAEHCITCRDRFRAWKDLRIRGGRLVDGFEPIFVN